jgi:hypothetical protein
MLTMACSYVHLSVAMIDAVQVQGIGPTLALKIVDATRDLIEHRRRRVTAITDPAARQYVALFVRLLRTDSVCSCAVLSK